MRTECELAHKLSEETEFEQTNNKLGSYPMIRLHFKLSQLHSFVSNSTSLSLWMIENVVEKSVIKFRLKWSDYTVIKRNELSLRKPNKPAVNFSTFTAVRRSPCYLSAKIEKSKRKKWGMLLKSHEKRREVLDSSSCINNSPVLFIFKKKTYFASHTECRTKNLLFIFRINLHLISCS